MLLVMMFLKNRWYIVKICICHYWVSMRGNTLRFDVNSFDTYSIHIGLPPDYSDNSYDGWNICYGWIDHLYHRYTKSWLYQMPQTEYLNYDFRSWIYIKKMVLVTYSMSYHNMVSVVPFLVMIIVFAPARATDQIWWCPFQIPHLCEISHLLTYKLSHAEHVIRLPPNNLYCLNLLIISYPKALLMVMSSTIQCLPTIVRPFSLNATQNGP